jgi:hypothetical protein
MRARHLSIPVAVAALALGAAPVAPAVTIAPKLLASLQARPVFATVPGVVTRKDRLRSCQAGTGNRAGTQAVGRAGETQRRASTVACEQPPRSVPNLPGLSNAQTAGVLAAG